MNIKFEDLLDEFLKKWDYKAVTDLSLSNYVGIRNKETFCQWVETKTKPLGSIKGLSSIKFGIYERNNKNKKPKNYINDDKYSWLKAFGNNRTEAFEKIKIELLKTIDYSLKGNFSAIDNLLLPNLYKWKIAFLYSNERLIPIYQHAALISIANSLGLRSNRKTKISSIQNLMVGKKPSNLSVYDYMRELFTKYGIKQGKIRQASKQKIKPHRGRIASTVRNTNSQVRSVSRSFIVDQKHNKLQSELKQKLIDEYGANNVLMEENYVDIKLLQPNHIIFFEIKSSSYASNCIKEALGQILSYTFHDKDKREKKIVVVGQYPPNTSDIEFIDYIKTKLNLSFEYINVDLN